MDNNEATSTVLSRIQKIDPENGSKIMGYILLKDPGEKEMIRLAFGPENHLIGLINQMKLEMGLSSNTSSASPFIPITNPNRPNPFAQSSSSSSPRIIVPNNGFHISPSSPSSPWFHSPKQPPSASSLSYAAVVNGNGGNNSPNPFASPSNPSFVSPFYQNGDDEVLFLEDGKNLDFNDPIVSPGGRSDSMLFPYGNGNENHHQYLHRRSVSVNDVFLGQSDENGSNVGGGGGYGWKPCMYFAKGFCKNGGGCKFVHGGFGADSPDGSPKFDGFDEMLRMKAIQHQRLALAAGHPLPYNNRCMSFLNDSPRSAAAAAAVMMGDEYLPFGRCRHDRSEFAAAFGFREHPNSSSRQIYLTFPADSTFKEEDVSNYFSSFGPVQDVRIPYQQKRMFGFVTFVYPETVKQILAKGNPHFVCDSRVLVKPYKEKGKLPDKKHHMEMGEFPACFSPSGPDSMEPFDLPFGRRMLYNSQEMMFRRKLEEQAELQQAIELQGRRLMNLQLPDMINHNLNHQLHRHQLAVIPVPFPAQAYSQINQGLAPSSEGITQQALDGGNAGKDEAVSPTIAADTQDNESDASDGNDSNGDKQKVPSLDESESHGSILEHILPDSLFSSPRKSDLSLVSSASAEMDDSIPGTSTMLSSNLFPAVTSSRNMASLSSRFSEMPRKPLV